MLISSLQIQFNVNIIDLLKRCKQLSDNYELFSVRIKYFWNNDIYNSSRRSVPVSQSSKFLISFMFKAIIHQCRATHLSCPHNRKNLLSHIIRRNVSSTIIKTFLTTSTVFNYSELLHSHYASHNADSSSSILIECATSSLMTTFILSCFYFLVVNIKLFGRSTSLLFKV